MIGIARAVVILPAATLSVLGEPLAGLCIASMGLMWLCLLCSRIRVPGARALLFAILVMATFVTVPIFSSRAICG
jgi:hypothetical protein